MEAPNHDQLIEEDDYIDMDLTSPSYSTDFEFKMASTSLEGTSPADELFYNGKLLPMHQTTTAPTMESFTFPNASSELSQEPYCHESSDQELFEAPKMITKQPWTGKLKLVKQCNISARLRASRAYLKSVFGRNNSVTVIDKFENLGSGVGVEEKRERGVHQRTLSGSIKWQFSSFSSSFSFSSSTFSSSASFSSESSDDVFGQPVLRRSSSVNSDMETSIKGAIAYCKKSQLERD